VVAIIEVLQSLSVLGRQGNEGLQGGDKGVCRDLSKA